MTGGQTVYAAGDSFTLGYKFNSSQSLNIKALGVFDAGTPGLSGTYDLGLWDSAGNLLTSTSVSGLGDLIQDSFVWKYLPSTISLSPGDYVVGAAGSYTSGDDYAFQGTFTMLAGVTFLEDRYIDGSTLQFPTIATDTTPAWIGGNFAVPGPLPVLGAGAAFGWSRRLRRRVVAASRSDS